MKCFSFQALEPRRLCAVDLSVVSVEFPIGVLGPQDTAPVSVSIRNSGSNGVITPFSAKLYLSTNATLDDNDVNVGGFSIGSLPASTTAGVIAEIALKGRVPKGTYFGLVMVDTGLQIAESNEANNVTASFIASVNVLGATAGPLPIAGTDNADLIRISQTGSAISITKNGVKSLVHSGDVSQILIEVGGGNDQVYVEPSVVTPVYVLGGAGNDTIAGGSGHDTLTGSAGHDRIAGGIGNDLLNGNGGSDRLVGDAGADRIVAGDGDDFIDGGSSGDRLFAGAGLDRIFGGNGDDFLHTLDGQTDTLDGGAGTDTADEDAQDLLTSVEV